MGASGDGVAVGRVAGEKVLVCRLQPDIAEVDSMNKADRKAGSCRGR